MSNSVDSPSRTALFRAKAIVNRLFGFGRTGGSRGLVAGAVLLLILGAAPQVAAQGDGSLRGTVQDQQGGAMPGVTVTATSPGLMGASTAVTDGNGNYRLINLPPGTYSLRAEISGFTPYRRDGVLLRAGANFQVDIELKLGGASEEIVVEGSSPMLEISRPSNVLNIDAEFQKAMPVIEGHYWSDFLMMTPGVVSRPHNDGSGRQNYFGNAVEHRDAVTLMEGMYAGNYNDFNINRTGLSSEAIQDTEVKTGGVDAASPMGYGLVINMVSKTGGNQFKGSASVNWQPNSWNSNNVGSGDPATRQVHQYDFSLGGPIKKDKIDFFFAARYSDNFSGTGRTPELVDTLNQLFPGGAPSGNTLVGFQPWAKVTAKLNANHNLALIYQADRLKLDVIGAEDYEQHEVLSTGGPMYGGKLTSVWTPDVTTTFTVSYNTKGGNSIDSYDGGDRGIPRIDYHLSATPNQGTLLGSGLLATGGNWTSTACSACFDLDTSSILMLRGDLTWFKEGWGGSHEFKTGFLAMPQNKYEKTIVYLNNGFSLEERRMANPAVLNAATALPFHRQYVTGGLEKVDQSGKDSDIGVYVQDTWRPTDRLTATYGLRVDFVKRNDILRDLIRQKSTEIAPRFGFSYLLTENAHNVLRGGYVRIHQQLMGTRHPVPSFGGNDTSGLRDEYDINGDGVAETVIVTPPRTAATVASIFDPDLHQPYFDEYTLGFRKQFPGQIAMDIAGIVKINKEQYAETDINGIYPDGPNQRFIGFGKVDPNAGIIYRLTNNSWSTVNYRALQMTLTKNMTHGFQAMVALHRQWAKVEGEYNPTDPARFIAPNAFPNNKLIWRTDGVQDQNSLATGTSLTNNPMWNPYSVRVAATWNAPKGIIVASTYTIIAGTWNGPPLIQLASNDPQVTQFGSSTVTSSTGVRQSNPLATRIRFLGETRADGQTRNKDVHTVGIKFGKRVNLGGGRNIEATLDVYNLLNAGNYTEWGRQGPNRVYNPASYLTLTNPQTPRAAQVGLILRF